MKNRYEGAFAAQLTYKEQFADTSYNIDTDTFDISDTNSLHVKLFTSKNNKIKGHSHMIFKALQE